MNKEILLKIGFFKTLSKNEQKGFLDSLIDEIEQLDLRVGGSHDSLQLDWVIDYSGSSLDKGVIIDKIGDFLLSKDDLILNYEIK
jgi:hypothetical protein